MIAFISLPRFVLVLGLIVPWSLSLAKDQLDSAANAVPVAKLEPIIKSTGASNILDGENQYISKLKKSDIIFDLSKEGLMHSKQTNQQLQMMETRAQLRLSLIHI